MDATLRPLEWRTELRSLQIETASYFWGLGWSRAVHKSLKAPFFVVQHELMSVNHQFFCFGVVEQLRNSCWEGCPLASSDCNISITITQFQCTDYFYRRAIYLFFFAAGFGIIFGFLVLCFPAFLLFAFPSSLPVCLSALPASFHSFLLPCFPCFSAFLLLCFTCFFSFLLLCFPCFSASCLCYLFVFSFLLLYSLLFVNTLGETQRNLKEILIRTPDKKLTWNPKETIT